jgi:hypothetical protein
MFGFLIRKFFYDMWDNLYKLALINLGFLASLTIPILIPPLFESIPALAMGILALGILWCCVYLSAAALSLKALSDYRSFGFADFFRNLKTIWPAGLLGGGIFFIGYLLITMVLPFYFSQGSFLGLLLGSLVFWALLAGILGFQFFLPIRSRLDTKLPRVIRKCFIILLDNTGFCIFSGIFALVILAISVFLLFLFPGPGGILLFLDEALRLRLLKYDWLEANPGADRRKIPWDALLIDEREKTGTRSLKNLIFPWKD